MPGSDKQPPSGYECVNCRRNCSILHLLQGLLHPVMNSRIWVFWKRLQDLCEKWERVDFIVNSQTRHLKDTTTKLCEIKSKKRERITKESGDRERERKKNNNAGWWNSLPIHRDMAAARSIFNTSSISSFCSTRIQLENHWICKWPLSVFEIVSVALETTRVKMCWVTRLARDFIGNMLATCSSSLYRSCSTSRFQEARSIQIVTRASFICLSTSSSS